MYVSESRETHDSYGLLSFNRTHGSDIALFGSNIKHNDVITMTLKRAEKDRHLNSDWYSGKSTIAKVEMSYSQFAEAISSFGVGDGVPVTISYTEKNGHIEKPEFHSQIETFEEEFKEHTKKYKDSGKEMMDNISAIFEKNSVGKKDKEEILKMIGMYIQTITSNSDFIVSQFNEAMEKTVQEAKSEIEAFAQNKLDSIAKDAIAKKLEENENFLKIDKPVSMD